MSVLKNPRSPAPTPEHVARSVEEAQRDPRFLRPSARNIALTLVIRLKCETNPNIVEQLVCQERWNGYC